MLIFAIRNLLSRPMRTVLALLGLTVAIGGMVGLFSVAEGLNAAVSHTFGRIPGLLVLQPGAPIPIFSRLPADWGAEMEQVDGVAAVSPEVWQRVNLINDKMIISPPRFLFGTDIPSRLQLEHGVYRDDLVAGRFLTLEDRGTMRAVVSRPIADEFEADVGDILTVNGFDVELVGIYHSGSMLLDVAIIMDIDQVRSMTRFDSGSVSAFYVEPVSGTDQDELIAQIKDVFRGREQPAWQPSSAIGFQTGEESRNIVSDLFRQLDRRLKGEAGPPPDSSPSPTAEREPQPEDSPVERTESAEPVGTVGENSSEADRALPVEVRTAMDWADRFDDFSKDLNLFLTVMTGIGVTIAVLSIVNTMLMSVSERIIEFGILKANGWSKLDVLKLITFESAVLGIGGGLLGNLLGWSATVVINSYWPERVQLYASPGLLLFAVLFSTVLGILGGLYPAIWATRMMPMDAIRRG